jgi:hypothetical protein
MSWRAEQLELPLGDRVAVYCGESGCPRFAVAVPSCSEWVRIICPVCGRYGDRPPASRPSAKANRRIRPYPNYGL